MKWTNEFKDLISKHVEAGDKLIIAVSGGLDSVCLLDLLMSCSFRTTDLIVAHLDHGLRSDSSEDAVFVERLAKQYGLEYVGRKLTVSKEGNVEANARLARYEFLADVRDETGAKYIVTAHHKNDQLETVMLNFLRGSFIKGLGGMNLICENKKVFRPLLSVSRLELEAYAQDKGLKYVVDSTNADSSFDRNFLRNDVIPALDERFGNLNERIFSNAGFYKELSQYLSQQVGEWIDANSEEAIGGRKFALSTFCVQPSFFKFMVLDSLLDSDLSQADFAEVDKLISDSSSGSFRQVGSSFVYVSTDHFLVSEFDGESLHGAVFESFLKNVSMTESAHIRTFRDGDRYKGKKLKEYFSKKNTPWYYRGGIPLSVDDTGDVIRIYDYQ